MKIIVENKNLLPKYETKLAAGLDLKANISKPVLLKPGERKLISTGVRISLDSGYEAQIRPRSGMALKFGVTVLNTPGTIDPDYLDEVKVLLVNLGNKDFTILPEMRIAQMVINKFEQVDFELVNDFSQEDCERNREGGFGSTGLVNGERQAMPVDAEDEAEEAQLEEIDLDLDEL